MINSAPVVYHALKADPFTPLVECIDAPEGVSDWRVRGFIRPIHPSDVDAPQRVRPLL